MAISELPLHTHHLCEQTMRRVSIFALMFSFTALAATASAQGPMPGAPTVEMLLAQTGVLQLSDAQVVRLAAIARRAEDRHRALRTRLDSLRPRRTPGDTARPRGERPTGMDLFEREREASHNDLRDALAVLSPDQQARAFEMVVMRRAMPFSRGPMLRDGGARDGGRPRVRPGAPPTGRPGEDTR